VFTIQENNNILREVGMRHRAITTILILMIIFLTWETGKLKTEKQNLCEQIEVLQNEKQELHTKIEQLNNQITQLNNQIEVSRSKDRSVMMLATAYSKKEVGSNLTKTETRPVEYRTCAVDPRVIPLGSLLYVKSDYPGVSGTYIAEDTGGKIKNKRIDIYMDNSEVKEFGKRWVEVTIIKKPASE
jgi:3D (Asp-Asp-Asp) domain-containing protein